MTLRPTTKRVLVGTAAAAAVVAAGLGALFAFTPKAKWPEAVPGRPLLQQGGWFAAGGGVFPARQVGVQFSPPVNWSMQVRSTESPHEHKPERTVVKYKRLIPGLQVAWLKLSVADAPED